MIYPTWSRSPSLKFLLTLLNDSKLELDMNPLEFSLSLIFKCRPRLVTATTSKATICPLMYKGALEDDSDDSDDDDDDDDDDDADGGDVERLPALRVPTQTSSVTRWSR